MQRKCKRLFCVVLIIVLSQLLCASASAEEYFGYQEVPVDSYESFYNAVIGNWYNVDNKYGAQCWDGASLFWMQVKGERLTTGSHHAAKDCWNESRDYNAGDYFYLITDVSKILKGDVIVFGAGSTGHICFADEDYVEGMTTINVLGQNQTNASFTYGHAFDVVSYDLDSFLGAFRYIGWADQTAPVFGRAVEISNIHSKGFTASCHVDDNREIAGIWAVAWPVEDTDRRTTFAGTYDYEKKTAAFEMDIETIGYLGHGYSFTIFAKDKTGNVGMLTPITAVSLYKMDISENGTYKARTSAKVYITPYESFNGISTHAYTLEQNQQKNVIGSYTENGIKWYRLETGGAGADQWVRAAEMTKISAWESLWNSIQELLTGNQTTAYVVDEDTVYTCSDTDTITIAGSYSSSLTNLNMGDPTATDPEAVVIDEVSFPDADFQAYIRSNFDLDGDGVLSSEELEAVRSITVSRGRSVKGVEHFSNLSKLSIGQNAYISQLDLTQNLELTDLECYSQPLQSLNLTCNSHLQRLVCTNSNLNGLNLSQNTKLTTMDCSGNELSSLDLSSNPELETLTCTSCILESLDLSANPKLSYLNCSDNKTLKSLNVRNCRMLVELWCRFCHLSEIDVSQNALLNEFWCCGNDLSSLDVSHNPNLGHLYCVGNKIERLDVSNNPLLWGLSCGDNLLTELDVSHNPELSDLSCFGNQIRFLNLRQNPRLTGLRVYSNQLTSLDLTENSQLGYVWADENSMMVDNYLDLDTLPEFDVSKMSNASGGLVLGHYLVFTEATFTYNYLCNDSYTLGFYLKTESPLAVAGGTCGTDAWWMLDETGILTIFGSGRMSQFDSYQNAAPWRHYSGQIREIVVDEGISSIGDYAFADYQIINGKISAYPLLLRISLPSSLTLVGNSAFENCCMLESIVLPDSVMTIKCQAFYGCRNLTSVTMPASMAEIGYSAFEGCSLESICIPYGITTISYDTFCECTNLRQITIPETVSVIQARAFKDCTNISSIYIPKGVSEIQGRVFQNCSALKEISVAAQNPTFCSVDGILFSKDMSKLVCYPAAKAGSYCIPQSVQELCGCAFYGCKYLTDITIPDNVLKIGYSAFASCISITYIDIPDGVTELPDEVFSGCVNLLSVNLPSTLTSIYSGCFSGCSSLKTLIIPDTVTCLLSSVFQECSNLVSVQLPDAIAEIYPKTFQNCVSLREICIPLSVTVIWYDAFDGCDALQDVYYVGTHEQWDTIEFRSNYWNPESPDGNAPLRNARIHYGASFTDTFVIRFDANGGINAPPSQRKLRGEALMLTDSVPGRSGYYFLGWSETPNALDPEYPRPGTMFTRDADTVLYAVWAKPDFILPNMIQEIGEEAFAGGAFRFAELPKHAVMIGSRAFADCPGLKYIYIYDEVTDIAADAFGDKEKLTIFGVGPYQGVKSAAQVFAEEHGFTFIPISYRISIIVRPSAPIIEP